jgi:hypothetical protein
MVSVDDYHEFSSVQRILGLVIPGIKVKEIGFSGCDYWGVAYTGKLTDPDNAAMIQSLKLKQRKIFESFGV